MTCEGGFGDALDFLVGGMGSVGLGPLDLLAWFTSSLDSVGEELAGWFVSFSLN